MPLDYRAIMSGRRRGIAAGLMRTALGIASVPYGIAVQRRNGRYDRGAAESFACDVPVISVGNVTTGGTGKTPIVCALAKWFRDREIRVAIVSRGYGRGSDDSNDEAKELHARLPDVPHIQDPDRVAAARIATEELEAQVILMDDGFQHRRLRRDLDVVVIDSTCPFGYGRLLPRGLLREPLASLSRADLVILSRCSAVDEDTLGQIRRRVGDVNSTVPIVHSDHRPACLLEYPDRTFPIDSLRDAAVASLSAIGNPQAFEDSLHECGASVVDRQRLPDHDPYSPETVARLRDWARDLAPEVSEIVCTHKDLVKLQTDRLGGRRIVALQIELQWSGDATPLENALERCASKVAADQQ